jgi:hypothetical protein
VFFEEQSIEAITAAIENFEKLSFDPLFIRKHAETFDEFHFVEKLQDFIYAKSKNASEIEPVKKVLNY